MSVRSLILGLSLLHLGCAGSPRSAPPAPRRTHEAPPPAPPEEGVLVRPDATGLRVSYRSLQPAQRFRLEDRAAEIRSDTWKVLDAGLSLADGAVVAPAPVRGFVLAIAPDTKQRDRLYPALTRVGEGWLVYAPYLRLADATAPERLAFETPAGWSVLGHRDERGALAGDGYVFVGPSGFVHRGVADVVGAASTPAWLLQEIETSTNEALAFYEKELGGGLGRRATIVVTHDPAESGSFRGDTTPGAMMSLRFYGASWSARESASLEVVADFVHHELFHFWNGDLTRSSQGDTRPWLHEGGANYAALMASRARGTMSDEKITAALNRHLERCQAVLGSRDLRSNGPKRGGDTYACGTVLQWAVDIGLRKSSNGQRDALSWWKDILAKARTEGGSYSLESAHALIGPEASRAADLLLDPGDQDRWATFADAARAYGVPMAQRRQAGRDLATALDHVLALHCGRERGFFTFADHVKLDTGTRCGPLSGDLEVDAIAGQNPVVQASAMYDQVRQRCAAGKTIDFAWKGKIVARAACTAPLPKPVLAWQIEQK